MSLEVRLKKSRRAGDEKQRMRYELASTCLTYRYIHTNIHTYIHKYSDFLVVLISVGLTQAHPN